MAATQTQTTAPVEQNQQPERPALPQTYTELIGELQEIRTRLSELTPVIVRAQYPSKALKAWRKSTNAWMGEFVHELDDVIVKTTEAKEAYAPTEGEQPEQPSEQPAPEQPAEAPVSEQPTEAPVAEPEQPEQPSEQRAGEQPKRRGGKRGQKVAA